MNGSTNLPDIRSFVESVSQLLLADRIIVVDHLASDADRIRAVGLALELVSMPCEILEEGQLQRLERAKLILTMSYEYVG